MLICKQTLAKTCLLLPTHLIAIETNGITESPELEKPPTHPTVSQKFASINRKPTVQNSISKLKLRIFSMQHVD